MRTSGKISVITLWDYMHRFPESLHSQSSPDIDCYQYDCERQGKNMNHGPVGYFVLDYRIKGYYYVGRNIKNLFGFPPEAFMEGGIPFCHHQMVKEDLEVFSTAAFPSRLLLIQSVKDELEQYWFSINYRLKRMDGKTIQVLQQFIVLEADEQGTSIRNDFVLTKRDATVESSFYVSLLTEAKKLIDGGANISLEAMINNVVTEMGSGKPTAAISDILTNEFSHLGFRDGMAYDSDNSSFSKTKLLESITHTQPMSLKWESRIG